MMLKMILNTANYLNSGSVKENAPGIMLGAFNFFDSIKSYDKTLTILEFWVQCLHSSDPKVYQFWEDFL
jgi:hypothetical protein